VTFLLDAEQLLHVASNTIGTTPRVRDRPALELAAARPAALDHGVPAYRGLFDQAAALLYAIAVLRPLVDGNLRLAWAAARTMLYLNGVPANRVDVLLAEGLVRSVADGRLTDIPAIAGRLAELSR
jgi:death-on-curing protein